MPESMPDPPVPDAEYWKKILNGLPIGAGCATLEANPRMLFINDSFTRLFGYTLEDIPTVADWARLAYPDEAYRMETFREWDAAVENAVRTKGRVEQMEFQVVCKNGEGKDVLFSAIVLEDRLVVSLVDITARRQAEAEARSAQEQLERAAYEVTENIPAGTYTMVLPPDGGMAHFSFMSSRFLELCGLERKAAEENPFNAFACVHPEDRGEWIRKNAECFEKKIPFSEECRVIAHGVERWIHAESIPRQRPDGTMVWEGVLTDISPQKRAEQELAELRERERQSEEQHRLDLESKLQTSLTAAAVAHEINQPLSRVVLTAQLALREAGELANQDPRLFPFLKELATEAERVVETIDKMKSLLRNVETVHTPIDLIDVVENALLYCKPLLKEHGVEVSFRPRARAYRILGDGTQLQMALRNLLLNAAEAISSHPAAGPRRIVVALKKTGGRQVLSVGDSGPGLTAAESKELLLRSTKPKGSGLGLFIVQTTMENHGGRLEIGRSKWGGAEFRMVFGEGGREF
jgi:signal transduction histidine kinase